MTRAFFFEGREQACSPVQGDSSSLERALARTDGVLWVDVVAPGDEELGMLARVFGFHPLSIEDCRTYSELPKVEEFLEYVFIVTHYVVSPPGSAGTQGTVFGELDVFMGRNFVVTVHAHPAGEIDECVERFRASPAVAARGADFLAHALIDRVVDSYFPLARHWDDRLDETEERLLLGRRGGNVLRGLAFMRRDIAHIRKIVAAEREAMSRLARRDVRFVSEQAAWYFRDVSDHLLRVHGILDSARETVSTLLELHISMLSHRTNTVMQKLTIVATIFLPLTFIAGVYGMNFRYMPELEWRYGYYFVWVVMLMVGGGFLAYFRRRGWL